jgi:hypothetical protein
MVSGKVIVSLVFVMVMAVLVPTASALPIETGSFTGYVTDVYVLNTENGQYFGYAPIGSSVIGTVSVATTGYQSDTVYPDAALAYSTLDNSLINVSITINGFTFQSNGYSYAELWYFSSTFVETETSVGLIDISLGLNPYYAATDYTTLNQQFSVSDGTGFFQAVEYNSDDYLLYFELTNFTLSDTPAVSNVPEPRSVIIFGACLVALCIGRALARGPNLPDLTEDCTVHYRLSPQHLRLHNRTSRALARPLLRHVPDRARIVCRLAIGSFADWWARFP